MRTHCSLVLILLAVTSAARAGDVRDFNADTPGKNYSPYTVAQGYFQVESDTIHVTHMGSTQTIETLDPVLKYGLTDNLDLELQTGGFLSMASKTNGRSVSQDGYGDTVPEVKLNIYGNDHGAFSAALKFGVKIPTASPGFGNGAAEYYFILPTQFALSETLSLQVEEEIDLLKNQNDDGKHLNAIEDVSLSRSLGKYSLSLELFAQSGTDARSPPLYTVDFGVAYALSPVIVISFGTYVGLNRYAPGIEGYTGFGFRF